MKILTDKIKGFAEMSDADKVAALLSLDLPDPVDMSQFVEKKVFDAKATEASNLSKQLKAKMSDEEAKAAKEAEERAAMEKELASLRKEKAIGTYKAAYLELGYDAEAAAENAEALHSGDFAKVFSNQKKFIEAQKKAAAAGALDKQPGLSSGNPMNSENVESSPVNAFRKGAGI